MTKKVVVEVFRGVAEVTKCPRGVAVEIIDWDNLEVEGVSCPRCDGVGWLWEEEDEGLIRQDCPVCLGTTFTNLAVLRRSWPELYARVMAKREESYE